VTQTVLYTPTNPTNHVKACKELTVLMHTRKITHGFSSCLHSPPRQWSNIAICMMPGP